MQHYLAYFIPVALSLLLSSLLGCDRDLGECNLDGQTSEPDRRPIPGPAALDIAYRVTDGLPMYEGQALVQSSCGDGGSCHSPAAEGSERIGVPAGLDFDVSLACNECVDSTCADPGSCDGNAQSMYCEDLQRLDSNQSRTNSWAGGMIAEIRNGSMPPGEAGRSVRDPARWIRGPRAANPDGPSLGTPLPTIGSAEAEEIVRNWLACAAPVVARTELPPSEDDQLKSCGEACVYAVQTALPDPTWSSIYANLIFPSCLLCHGPENREMDQNPDNPTGVIPGGASSEGLAALNLSGVDPMDTSNWASDSHAAVFDVPSSAAGDCEGQGTLVVPNDSAGSLMIQKLRADQTCGDEMPPVGGSQTICNSVIEVVEAWIDMGAPNN
ncbi:MAG: hypothetical protein OER77_08545 [Myxococcales bacterium]|nr:hypothetical protein [Myxococcales bacterium]